MPFLHLAFAALIPDRTEVELLDRLEAATWVKRAASFYRFSVPQDDGLRSSLLDAILDQSDLRDRRRELEHIFECRLGDDFRLEVHRYEKGDGIGAHTDFLSPEVRCVLSLNREWDSRHGGVWVLASGSALQDSPVYIPSLSGTGFIFGTAINSFHALSVYSGNELFGLTIRIPRLST